MCIKEDRCFFTFISHVNKWGFLKNSYANTLNFFQHSYKFCQHLCFFSQIFSMHFAKGTLFQKWMFYTVFWRTPIFYIFHLQIKTEQKASFNYTFCVLILTLIYSILWNSTINLLEKTKSQTTADHFKRQQTKAINYINTEKINDIQLLIHAI